MFLFHLNIKIIFSVCIYVHMYSCVSEPVHGFVVAVGGLWVFPVSLCLIPQTGVLIE